MKKHFHKKGRYILLALAIMLLKGHYTTASAKIQTTVITYEVKKDDTLWDIAKEYRRENEDIRETIDSIMDINNLETSVIYPGEILEVLVDHE